MGKETQSPLKEHMSKPVRVTVSRAPYWKHFRVFKMRGGYICGVCRRSYSDENHAKACVNSCSGHYAQSKIETLVRGLKTRFRCPFCYREYHDSLDATSCIARCKTILSGETGSVLLKEAAREDAVHAKGRVLPFFTAQFLRDDAFKPSVGHKPIPMGGVQNAAEKQIPGRGPILGGTSPVRLAETGTKATAPKTASKAEDHGPITVDSASLDDFDK